MWEKVSERRRFQRSDEFYYGFSEMGYVAEAIMVIPGHEHCGCYRADRTERVRFYLSHDDAIHGKFPMESSVAEVALSELYEQLRYMGASIVNQPAQPYGLPMLAGYLLPDPSNYPSGPRFEDTSDEDTSDVASYTSDLMGEQPPEML